MDEKISREEFNEAMEKAKGPQTLSDEEIDSLLKALSNKDEEEKVNALLDAVYENSAKNDELGAQYAIYASECEAAMDVVYTQLKNFRSAIDRAGQRNPIDGIIPRVKSYRSVVDKCKKHGYPLTIDGIKEHVKDVVGIRIITKYLDEIYMVRDLVHQIMLVDCEEDYIDDPKESGYRSLHLSCHFQIYDPYAKTYKLIPIEVQIRSRSMNLWAVMEHDLGYSLKKMEGVEDPPPEVIQAFKEWGDFLHEMETRLMYFRDKIISQQK